MEVSSALFKVERSVVPYRFPIMPKKYERHNMKTELMMAC
jgi:hypothetical protein